MSQDYNSPNHPPSFPSVSVWTYPQFLASPERRLAANKPQEPLPSNAPQPSTVYVAPETLVLGISISARASIND